MRITDLQIDGFGVWSGLELPALSDQVIVLYGANEAGKTTLMQFVRSMLYGFSPERRARYLPPLRPGRPGGTLRAIDADVAVAISRHAAPDGDGEELLVGDEQGEGAKQRLSDLLGDVDEPVFTHVFAIGLREIQELGTLSETEAGHLLYDLTLGLDRVSLVDVLRELDKSRNRLLSSDDHPSLVVQLLGERERLQGEVEELCDLSARYLELLRQREQVTAETERLQTENEQLGRQARLVALARSLGEKWRGRTLVDQQLSAIGPIRKLPDEALGRLNALNARLDRCMTQRRRIKRKGRQLRTEAGALVVNEALCRQAPRLEALNEQQQWIASLGKQIEKLTADAGQLEAQRQAGLAQWGLPVQANASTAQISTAQISPKTIANLRAQAASLKQLRARSRAARQQIDGSRESMAKISRQIHTALASRPEKNLTKSLERTGQLVSQLRHRIQIDERLEKMAVHETELAEDSQRWLDRQMLPTWVLAGLGGLFVLGLAMILAGLVLPASFIGPLGWPLALLGIGGTAVGGLTKFYMEHSAAKKLESCESQQHTLRRQIEQAKQDRDELDKQLPRGGGPMVARLQTAEKELAALEELLPLGQEREAAEHEAQSAAEQRRQARTEFRDAQKRWQQSLSQAGLPTNLTPKQLRQFQRHHRQSSDDGRKLATLREELSQRQGELQILANRIAQLSSEAGIKPASDEPLAQLRALLAELHEHDTRWKRRLATQEQVVKLKRKHARIARLAAKVRQRRRLLLREAGTTDEADFRRLATAQAEVQRLKGQRETLNQEIAAALAGNASEAEMAARLDGAQNLERIEQESTRALQDAGSRLQRLFEQRGEMNQQLKSLVADRRLSEKQIELAIVDERLREALDRWRILAVCGLVLQSVRELYERERQPEALREASGYLERLTGGRYRRVWTPLGQSVLRVDDAEGRSLPAEVLSRGAREQLFLSLRLALVNSYARRGIRLPLVLDDVLVNFDAGRAKAAAAVLRDFARSGHQLLVFTCHEHVARMFKSMRVEVRRLPDNVHPGAAVADLEEPVKKPRRQRSEGELQRELVPDEAARAEPPAAKEEGQLDEASAVEAAAEPIAETTIQPARREPIAPPAPLPPPAVQRPAERRMRLAWDAEEFAGELADRVRPAEPPEMLARSAMRATA